MRSLKLIFFLICVHFFTTVTYSGEPGTEETASSVTNTNSQKIIDKKEVKEQKFTDTNIKIPKNPIDTIFLQPFGKVIDPRFARILGNCLPAKKGYGCKIVAPKKKSTHFNKYFYYLNSNKAVYGVVAFSDYRVGNVEQCRSLIKEWNEYFKHFDFETKTKEDNLDQLILYTKAIKPSEVYMSCYPESYRDVKSYFSLKLFVHEN